MDDLSLAVDLVTRAGTLAAQLRADSNLNTEQKTSVSDVVTVADHAAEALVVETLRELRPDDGVLGEEGAAADGTSGRVWVIDPVDGTYNFASGMHYWCSALALKDSVGDSASPDGPANPDHTVLGAVHQPATGETWTGGRDLPARLNGRELPRLVDAPLSQLSIGSYIHPTRLADPNVLEPWLAMIAQVATPRVLGSGSVDLASVASGRLGCWAQVSCPEWDWLPGQALVRSAGGATAVVEHRGYTWYLAGRPTAVEQLRAVLRG